MNCYRIWPAILLLGLVMATGAARAQTGSDYLLNPGDVLQVSVWNEEELERDVLVRPDGGISFPLVGDVVAAERSVADVQDTIRERLGSYVPDAVVTVSVLAANGNKVYVLGKVARPGEYAMGNVLDVMQVLAMAGGITAFAAENKIQILRREDDGKQMAYGFRYGDVKEGESLQNNILIQSGDIVVVP